MYENYSLVPVFIRTCGTMKLILALFAVLAVSGLGQAHILPDFGSGPNSVIPKHQLSADFDRSLIEELTDFVKLIPLDQFVKVVSEYVTKDQKVQKAFSYLMNPEFHDLLRELEKTKQHQAFVVFLEKEGIPAIKSIQEFHRAIGMDEYVPPKIESMFESQIGVEKVGEGVKAMFEDLAALLPTDKIKALYDEKMKTKNAFSDFVNTLNTQEVQKMVVDLYSQSAYQKLFAKCEEQGLDLKAMSEFYKKIIPIPLPSPSVFVA